MKKLLPILGASILFAGCSSTVTLNGIAPAKVDEAAKLKTLSVLSFQNDAYGFADKLENKLSSKTVRGKPFFTLVDRVVLDKVLDEQKLQYSGLVDEKTSVKIGKLVGAKGLITGSINDPDFSKTRYKEKRTKCKDDKCKKTVEYSVVCTSLKAYLSASIKLLSVEQGRIVYADSISDSREYSHCRDEEGGLPAYSEINDRMAHSIAAQFVSQISPNAVSFNVELLDDPMIDMTSAQKKSLEASIELLEEGRWDKAERLLSALLTETNDRSVVAAYNLGVVKELQGDYAKAEQLYRMADNLTKESVDEINIALARINKRIRDREKLKEQL